MEKVDVSIVISILSLIISLIVGYFAYFRRGKLYYSIPPKILIRTEEKYFIICCPIVATNSGVLPKTIDRLHAKIVSVYIPKTQPSKYIMDATFQWNHFPPGGNDIEAISPIIVPASNSVNVPIGLVGDAPCIVPGYYEFILYASIGPKLSKKHRLKEVLRFRFHGSYLQPKKPDKWESLYSEHDDPNISKIQKEFFS